MNYQHHRPSPHLSDLVSYYWTLDGQPLKGETVVHRTLANYYPELIFHYGGAFREIVAPHRTETTFTGGLHGQTDQVRRFCYNEKCGIFGVMLQPFAVPLLLGIPSSRVANQLVDLHTLLGVEGKMLTERMMAAPDNTTRIRLINTFLEARLTQQRQRHPAIAHIVHSIYTSKGMVDIQTLAGQAYRSQRQFERNFKEQIGFTAKSFAKLVRFKSLMSDSTKKSLTRLAYDYGYYDQSHLIQDFRKFTGYTPLVYFKGRAEEVFYAPR